MKVLIKDNRIIDLFNEFIKNSKVLFNFRVKPDKIEIQLLSDFVMETTIPCSYVAGPEGTYQISIYITEIIHVFKRGELFLEVDDSSITFEQGNSTYTLLREYEERKDLPNISGLEFKPAYADRLKYLVHSTKSMSTYAKELKVFPVDPIFMNNRFYVRYEFYCFVEDMNFEQSCIPMETLQTVIFKLDKKSEVAYFRENDYLVFKSKNYVFWVPTSNYNISASKIQSIDKILASLTPVTTINISELAGELSYVAGIFSKQKANLSVGEGCICIDMTSAGYEAHTFVGTKITRPLLRMTLSNASLQVIPKIFKDDEEVEILKGGNCLCLRHNTKTLLIAGMLY